MHTVLPEKSGRRQRDGAKQPFTFSNRADFEVISVWLGECRARRTSRTTGMCSRRPSASVSTRA
jgi:hypothetical protein